MKNVIKRFKTPLLSFIFVLGLVVTSVGFGAVSYADNVDQACIGAQMAQGKTEGEAKAACASPNLGSGLTNFVNNIINILLFLIGAIAVIMIIIGGIRYVTSGGDSSQTKGARDTILYAVIGLVIAIMSYAIVNFVLRNL